MVEPAGDLLTVREAAALLKVSPFTVYRWISDGRLPAVRFSPRVIRVRRRDLEGVGESEPPRQTFPAVREVAVAEYRPGNHRKIKEVINMEEELRELQHLLAQHRAFVERPRSPAEPPKGSWEALKRHVGCLSEDEGSELWRAVQDDRARSLNDPVKWPIFSTRRP